MRKFFNSLCIIFLFFSCSSYRNSNSNSISDEREIYSQVEKEFRDIENSDFAVKRSISYVASKDVYRPKFRVDDSLSSESLNKAPDSVVSSFLQSKDEIAKIAALCYQHQFEEAQKILDGLYSTHKENPAYWNQQGSCSLLNGRKSQAELFYNKARNISEKFAPAINNLGVIYFREGRYNKALAAFNKAYEITSFSLTPVYNLANANLIFGNIEQAKKLLMILKNKRPQDNDVINALCYVELFNGNFPEALRLYSNIDKKYLTEESASLGLAYTYAKLGRSKDAEKIMSYLSSEKVENQIFYQGIKGMLGM